MDTLGKALENLSFDGGQKSLTHDNFQKLAESEVSFNNISRNNSQNHTEKKEKKEVYPQISSAKNEYSLFTPEYHFHLVTRELNSIDQVPKILSLPHEVLELIISYLPQPISVELLYVCRRFYQQGLPFLYQYPILDVYNYPKFVATLSGSSLSTAPTASQIMKGNRGYIYKAYQSDKSNNGKDLGSLVRTLDLRNIVQSGRNSYTARVLRRCSSRLQAFFAPQTSFGYSPLVSLRSCTQLKILDLSLVSETVDLRLLFSAISSAHSLERLSFPRSSIYCSNYDNIWPPNLKYLDLSGGINDEFINSTIFPNTITHLTIIHCPFITEESVKNLLYRLGLQLTTLKVFYPMPLLKPNTLDSIFMTCPILQSLSVSVDYISRQMFEDVTLTFDAITNSYIGHGLKHLRLDSSGTLGQSHKLDPIDISIAILDGKLPKLFKLQVTVKLSWNTEEEDVMELAEILSERNGGIWIS